MKNADHKEFCVKVAGLCRLNRARLSYKWLQQCFSSRFLLLLMLITVAVVAAAVVVTIVGVFFFVVCRAHAVQQSGVLSSQRIIGAVYHTINYMSPFALFNILLIIFITDFYFI